MADLACTDTAEPRRPSLRVAVRRERYQVLASPLSRRTAWRRDSSRELAELSTIQVG